MKIGDRVIINGDGWLERGSKGIIVDSNDSRRFPWTVKPLGKNPIYGDGTEIYAEYELLLDDLHIFNELVDNYYGSL